MWIVGVLNSKGGVGKTTLATNIAVRASQDYARVGVLDMDPQQGAGRWFNHRKSHNNPVLLVGENDPDEAYEKMVETGWDFIVLDGAPSALDRTVRAIERCDIVVVPMRSGDQDVGSAQYVTSACLNADVPFMVVLNDARNKSDQRAINLQNTLASDVGLPVAKTIIIRSALIEDAMTLGMAACEFKKNHHKQSRDNVEALYQEITAQLKLLGRPGAQRQ